MEMKRRHFLSGIGGSLIVPAANAAEPVARNKVNSYKVTLSTHILDMVSGKPASNVKVNLYQETTLLFEGQTNQDGRCVILPRHQEKLAAGYYQLAFYVAEYFKRQHYAVTDPAFLNIVRIDFGIAENPASDHYHVPLLLSPYGFSTYKGS
ncbi:hydroxyisourate hydrolase [Commensalibacter papalotli (ex Botero et al. 2024)]|uniref:5-hydroxyisourate hydrolase n=1 Tax=Commensalibacter papalotli (ex Botero et al. 2024) TaxID=2972766 RepID=A0ABM9HJV1_9PROT|nr:hydroxyisourate hydrolase [Commensalibacter papalotli (ex Botero et al. 2024)]CAI3923019.1 5-hydroxyisourate hydrolase (purine catabolism) [Commensalibacter papalotli (ex Botero et al. 2024)]CAI3929007.1 5-hydroxyisourate hydrolase (purine catabolism) [Commensalibacter papalotli (ex Botero et al. 2024)]